MSIFFKKKVDNIQLLPSSQFIYEIIFVEILKKIKNLELDYIEATKNKLKTQNDLKYQIEKNIEYLDVLFNENRTKHYINNEINTNNDNEIFINSTNKINQFAIFIEYFQTYWIIYEITENWIKAGGNTSIVSKDYLDKYEFIKFLNLLYKGFSSIDKIELNEKINKYINLLDVEQKKRYYSFEIYSILKKKELTNIDLENLNEYYKFIDYSLLDKYKMDRMFYYLEKYYTDKNNIFLNKTDLINYKKIINDEHNLTKNKQDKIDEYYRKYYLYNFNKSLMDADYLKNSDEIFYFLDKLEKLGYILNSKQKKKLEKFKLSLEKQKNEFDKNIWFPLFKNDELNCIKDIIRNSNDICKIIKEIYPNYKISNDFFCEKINLKTKKILYEKQEDIEKTINAYCVIMLMVGIINYKLFYTKQDYQIIIKGGKTLQFLLSKIIKENIDFYTSDIDLLINPIDGVEYDLSKCKNLSNNFAYLLMWMLNENNNPYLASNYISFEQGKKYKNLVKISYKIQNQISYYESGFTPLADIDFGKKTVMYNNLIYDFENSNKYGNLLYIYQNLNDFLLEKIYYLDFYAKELDKLILKSKQTDTKLSKEEHDDFNDYERFIDKFSKQIKLILSILINKSNVSIQTFLNEFIKKNNLRHFDEIDINDFIKYLL